jgi:hypothetical protein
MIDGHLPAGTADQQLDYSASNGEELLVARFESHDALKAWRDFGRPGPTDQAWIESLFSRIKADWPHLCREPRIETPGAATPSVDPGPMEAFIREYYGIAEGRCRRRATRV